MLESFLIGFTSLLAGTAISTLTLTGRYQKETLKHFNELDQTRNSLLTAQKEHVEDRCKLKENYEEVLRKAMDKNKDLLSLNAKAESTINELHAQLNQVCQNFESLSAEHQNLKISHGQALNGLNIQREELEEELSSLREQLEQSQQECQDVKNNYVAMANQANDEIGKLQTMLKTYHQALEETSKQLATAKGN